jgi:hypothetical protein
MEASHNLDAESECNLSQKRPRLIKQFRGNARSRPHPFTTPWRSGIPLHAAGGAGTVVFPAIGMALT